MSEPMTAPDAPISEINRRLDAGDQAAKTLGITLVEARAGYARAEMLVEIRHTNPHGICHGGMIFTLADTAFGQACNGHDRKTVASGADIDFLKPGQLGSTLVAEAIETASSGRSGLYDITIRDKASGEVVALMRGRSRVIGGPLSSG